MSVERKRGVGVVIVAAVLAALMTIPFVLQRGTINQLRAENSTLTARVEELTKEVAEANAKQTSKAPAQAASLTKDQLHELMRLRAEVSELRRQTNAPKAAAIARPNADLVPPEPVAAAPVGPAGEARPPWRNAGFAEPAAAASTMVWASETGQFETLLSAMTPEAQADLRQKIATGTATVDTLKAEAQMVAGVRPSPNHPPTENEAYFVMDFVAAPLAGTAPGQPAQPSNPIQGQNAQVVRFQKVGNQWLYAGRVGQ